MKQTAVEYLYKIIHARIHIDKDLSEYFNEAKEMEKQQIIDARDALFNGTGEDYYYETYKNNNK